MSCGGSVLFIVSIHEISDRSLRFSMSAGQVLRPSQVQHYHTWLNGVVWCQQTSKKGSSKHHFLMLGVTGLMLASNEKDILLLLLWRCHLDTVHPHQASLQSIMQQCDWYSWQYVGGLWAHNEKLVIEDENWSSVLFFRDVQTNNMTLWPHYLTANQAGNLTVGPVLTTRATTERCCHCEW